MKETYLEFKKNNRAKTKIVRRSVSDRDCKNVRIKYKNEREVLITFYDGCYQQIVKNGIERIEIARLKNRVYFKESDDGYKLSAVSRMHSDPLNCRRMGITTDILIGCDGFYSLQFDSELGLFYIDLKEGI